MKAQGRRRKRTMKVFFEHYGSGPWACDECGLEILIIGRETMDGNVHHRDGDPSNDDPLNLQVLHTVCHLRLHAPTEEMREQISAKLRGRPSPTRGMTFSAETNAKKGRPGPRDYFHDEITRLKIARPGEFNHFWGKQHTDETKAKMRQPRQRQTCEGCGREFAINWLRRHKCPTS